MNRKIGIIAGILILVGIFAFLILGVCKLTYNNNAKRIYQEASQLLQQNDYDAAAKGYERILSEFPKSAFVSRAQLDLIGAYLAAGNLLQARDMCRGVLQQNLEPASAKAIYEKLGELNVKILFSPAKAPDSAIYKIQDNDTLDSIAKKYNTTVSLIKRANNIKQDIIRPGMELKISTAKFSVVVDKSQNILTLKSAEDVVKTYRVSTGTNNSTPVGTFKIVNKITNPPWFSGGKAIPPGDPKNILGSRWLGLNLKGYGIHGTTDDASIGSQRTQGCVRMHNHEVEELYDIVPVGAEVTILD